MSKLAKHIPNFFYFTIITLTLILAVYSLMSYHKRQIDLRLYEIGSCDTIGKCTSHLMALLEIEKKIDSHWFFFKTKQSQTSQNILEKKEKIIHFLSLKSPLEIEKILSHHKINSFTDFSRVIQKQSLLPSSELHESTLWYYLLPEYLEKLDIQNYIQLSENQLVQLIWDHWAPWTHEDSTTIINLPPLYGIDSYIEIPSWFNIENYMFLFISNEYHSFSWIEENLKKLIPKLSWNKVKEELMIKFINNLNHEISTSAKEITLNTENINLIIENWFEKDSFEIFSLELRNSLNFPKILNIKQNLFTGSNLIPDQTNYKDIKYFFLLNKENFLKNKPLQKIEIINQESIHLTSLENLLIQKLIHYHTVKDILPEKVKKQWNEEIFAYWKKNFTPYFPFSKSQEDTSLEVFHHFFKPKGMLSSFIQENKAHQHLFPPTLQKSIKRMLNIQEAFYKKDSFGISFNITPTFLDPSLTHFEINIAQQRIKLPEEISLEKTIHIKAPENIQNPPHSHYIYYTQDKSTDSHSEFGVWSYLRFLQSITSKTLRNGPGNIIVEINLQNKYKTSWILEASLPSPIIQKELFNIKLREIK